MTEAAKLGWFPVASEELFQCRLVWLGNTGIGLLTTNSAFRTVLKESLQAALSFTPFPL